MYRLLTHQLILFLALISAFLGLSAVPEALLFLTPKAEAFSNNDFIRSKGQKLVVGNPERRIFLRGANFQNDHLITPAGEWTRDGSDDRSNPVTEWYEERHVRQMHEMGFNTIRFMMHYRLFEDNGRPGVIKPTAWAFIDRYLAWARKYDFYLILDMHCPPGGFQSWGQGGALWKDPQNQERLIALWKAIAKHYRDEPRIAAFDLLNEPMPYRPEQWKTLAQKIVNAIRSVDSHHVILVEFINWVLEGAENWNEAILKTFQFTIRDPAQNVMYDMHFYEPAAYTLQLTPATQNRDGGRYPDPKIQDRTLDGKMMTRTREQLAHNLRVMLVDFGRQNNVPLNIGEWAPMDRTFANKGGLTYIQDLLALFNQYDLNWQYYSFNEFYTNGGLQNMKAEPRQTFRRYFAPSLNKG